MEAQIGETRRAFELGMAGRGLMYRSECPICHKAMWRRKSARNLPCGKCAVQRPPKLVVQGYEAKRASELGYKVSGKDYWLFKDICPKCHTTLWRSADQLGKMCVHCKQQALPRASTIRHPRWVGGTRKRQDGYVEIVLAPDDPLFVMAHQKKHIALEHRIVMARALGRPLKPWEIVHHRNHNRSDNRIENLELLSSQHIHHSIGIEDQILQRLSRIEAKLSNMGVRLSLHDILLGFSDTGNPELGTEGSECRDSIGDAPTGRRESPSLNES